MNEYDCHIEDDSFNNLKSIRIINEDYCYNDSDFTFEDEVNLSHKIYGKRRKNYCDTFRLKLVCEIIKLIKLKNKIAENLILINEKQPDDWKKYIIQNMDNQIIFNEERNKWNKIIEKHKKNMFNNGIECDKLSCEVVKDYYELTTGSRRL